MGITLTSVCFGVARALAVDWVNIVWTEVVWLGYVSCIYCRFFFLSSVCSEPEKILIISQVPVLRSSMDERRKKREYVHGNDYNTWETR